MIMMYRVSSPAPSPLTDDARCYGRNFTTVCYSLPIHYIGMLQVSLIHQRNWNVHYYLLCIEYNISNGQLSDVTGSAHVMGRYLANAIVSDKSK